MYFQWIIVGVHRKIRCNYTPKFMRQCSCAQAFSNLACITRVGVPSGVVTRRESTAYAFRRPVDQMNRGSSLTETAQLLRIVTFAVIVAGLYFGRSVFIPLALALLLSVLLAPVMSLLARLRVPRLIGVLVVVAALDYATPTSPRFRKCSAISKWSCRRRVPFLPIKIVAHGNPLPDLHRLDRWPSKWCRLRIALDLLRTCLVRWHG